MTNASLLLPYFLLFNEMELLNTVSSSSTLKFANEFIRIGSLNFFFLQTKPSTRFDFVSLTCDVNLIVTYFPI